MVAGCCPTRLYTISCLAGGKKGAKAGAVKRMALSHMILPLMFQGATDAWKWATDDEDDPHEVDPMDYLRAVLLGPLNGLYIAGDALSPLASLVTGTKVWEPDLPIFQSVSQIFRATNKFKSEGFSTGISELVEAMGKITPTPLTYWSLFKRRIMEELLGFDD